ncbi:STAS domain-containing protein [Streptomyces sp. NPDC059900]|uniref:STAS domain-containing protein n=1 Tax=Streptomyces sp. NPDC059900 TaxID=3155816 RepID=UPI003416B190
MTHPEQAGTQPPYPPGGLTVRDTVTDGIRVLSLAGEIDHHSGPALHQALNDSDAFRPRVILELSRVSFMDSSGINILLAAHHTQTEAGGWLRLAAPATAVKRTLDLVGADTVIDCRTTLHQALV